MSRAYTSEEMRQNLLQHMKHLTEYWAILPGKTPRERCEGLAFSILNIFDGCSGSMPAFDLIPSPHADDKEFYQSQGENWYEPVVINDCMLHELFDIGQKGGA